MQSRKQKRLAKLPLISLLLLAACQINQTPTSAIDASAKMIVCDSFGRISYSRKDTLETREEIVEHNATYDSFDCLIESISLTSLPPN